MAKAKSKGSSKRKSARKSTKTESAMPSSEKSVNVKKARNGYVVNMWTEKGEATFIAKNEAEATKYIKKLL